MHVCCRYSTGGAILVVLLSIIAAILLIMKRQRRMRQNQGILTQICSFVHSFFELSWKNVKVCSVRRNWSLWSWSLIPALYMLIFAFTINGRVRNSPGRGDVLVFLLLEKIDIKLLIEIHLNAENKARTRSDWKTFWAKWVLQWIVCYTCC